MTPDQPNMGPDETPAPGPSGPAESLPSDADRALITQLIRDVRLISAMGASPLPAWVGAIERLIGAVVAAPGGSVDAPSPQETPYVASVAAAAPPAASETPAAGGSAAVSGETAATESASADSPQEPMMAWTVTLATWMPTMPSVAVAGEAQAASPPLPAPAIAAAPVVRPPAAAPLAAVAPPAALPEMDDRRVSERPASRPQLARIEPTAPPVLLEAPVSAAPDAGDDIGLGDLPPATAQDTFIAQATSKTMVSLAEPAPEPAAAEPEPDRAVSLARAYFVKGESYRRKRVFKSALACYTESIRLDPRNVPALLERGQIYRLARKFEQAVTDFNAALAVDPGHADGYVRHGNTLLEQGRPEEALDDYSAAIQLAPENSSIYVNRALAYARVRAHDNVIEDTKQALALDPTLASAYLLRGVAYSNKNIHDRRLPTSNTRSRSNRATPWRTTSAGWRSPARGTTPRRSSATAGPWHWLRSCPSRSFNRALANRLRGNYPMAIGEFSEFIQQQPGVPEAHFNRGLAYRASRQFAMALADFETALSLRADYAEAEQLRQETLSDADAASQGGREPAPSVPGGVHGASPRPDTRADEPEPTRALPPRAGCGPAAQPRGTVSDRPGLWLAANALGRRQHCLPWRRPPASST